jgi:hypothetical protein
MTDAGAIRGENPSERAIALAGWLAEHAVGGLCAIEDDGGWTPLVPRRTDLPHELLRRAEAGPVELVATDRPLRVVFTLAQCLWEGSPELSGSAPGRTADSDA